METVGDIEIEYDPATGEPIAYWVIVWTLNELGESVAERLAQIATI